MTYYIGIDGGGSNLRVAVIDDSLTVIKEVHAGKANPNVIGFDTSTQLIRRCIQDAIQDLTDPIVAVGIGISGAPKTIAEQWLRDTVQGVLPHTTVVPSSDEEIALVGANSTRRGILVLSGTGSIAFGVNNSGESLSVGGWGYVMGDVGSGFWLGLQALHAYVRQWEGTQERPSALFDRVKHHLSFDSAMELIPWLYRTAPPETHEIAKMARFVLEEAEAGDWKAQEIVETGAEELALLANTIKRRLRIVEGRVAFAGSLLTNPTILAKTVAQKLNLPSLPRADHSALVGAGLLAKLTIEGKA